LRDGSCRAIFIRSGEPHDHGNFVVSAVQQESPQNSHDPAALHCE
jgi:hypothetical protein